MTSRENPSRQPPGASQRPVPPPPPRGNVRSSSNRGPLVINTASSESKNNSSGRARNNRWGVRLQHLSPRPPPMVSPFNRVSNRPANLGPGGTPLQSLPGQVPRSRSFDFSPKPPLAGRRRPSLSQLLGDLVEEHVVDSEEKETPNTDSHGKNKNKSKYTVSATRLEGAISFVSTRPRASIWQTSNDRMPAAYHHAFSFPNFLYTRAPTDDLHRAKQKEAGLLYVKIYDLVLLMRHKSTKISTNKTMP